MEIPVVEIEALCAYVEINLEMGVEMNSQDWRQSTQKVRAWLDAAEQSVERTATPLRAKVVCSKGHIRVVEGSDWSTTCPECGVKTYEYDSRFGGL